MSISGKTTSILIVLGIFSAICFFDRAQKSSNTAVNGHPGSLHQGEGEPTAMSAEEEYGAALDSEGRRDQIGAPKAIVEPGPVLESVQEQWRTSRGFTEEYNRYFVDYDFLESAAASGDVLATQMLGYHKMGSPEGDEYLEQAALQGSIMSLHFLSNSRLTVAEGRLLSQKDGSEDFDQNFYAIEALEFLLIAELRGDNYAAPNGIPSLLQRITLTEEEIQQACLQAQNRLERMERARLQLGLPPFDNTPMPGLSTENFSGSSCSA